MTKYMSEIDFKASAKQGHIVEIGIEVVKFGKASLVLSSEVRNKMTISNIVMVNLGPDGKSKPHDKTEVEYVADRLD